MGPCRRRDARRDAAAEGALRRAGRAQPGTVRRGNLISAFDATRPPQRELIDDCVHCGFCLPTCPTYALWGEEMDSPRGRIVLMKAGLEQESAMSDVLVTHIDRCLGCMACVTACPSGVQYDKLIEDTRAQIERNHSRPWRERLVRRAIFETFPHPRRLRALVPLMAVAEKLGLRRRARGRGGLLDRAPRLRASMALAPDTASARAPKLPARTVAHGETRATVGLLLGCVQRVFFTHVNEATAAVLAAEGYEVHALEQHRCCGALQLHSGEDEPARELAKVTIAQFEPFDYVVTNAAGCGSAMKDYGHLLRDDAEWRERAAAFSAKVRDVTELLAEQPPRARRHPVELTVAYHDACHLAHAQAVRDAPRELLRGIPGIQLREPAEPELCCGSAGIYNLINPEPASELGRRKACNLLDTGTDVVAAGNPGCALQISAEADKMGRSLKVLHPVELLRMSIEGGAGGHERVRS